MATKASLENKLRNDFIKRVVKMVNDEMDTDALVVGSSELAIPCLDEENNEKFIKIIISIPRGERDGHGGYIPYDGYSEAEAYANAKVSKAQAKAVEKAMKEADKGKKKE